jgi:hypothetical protein
LLDASSSEDARFRGHDGLFADLTAYSRVKPAYDGGFARVSASTRLGIR